MLELKIGDILEKVKRKKKIKASDYKVDGRFPIIDQSENFIAGYTDDGDAIIDEYLPIIVFGDHTRRLKFIDFPFACGADGTQLIYPNREDIDIYFLYSALKAVDLSDFAYARHFKFLKDQVVTFPSYENQKEISRFLKRYDDLINNNQRRIRILEDMAQSLYREWFVHFRFLGHEKIKLINSPFGPIPQGWKWAELGKLVEVPRRAVNPSDISPDMPYIGLEHIPRKQMTLDAWGRPENVTSTKLRFFANEIIFGKIRPYFHKVVISPFEGVSSSDAIIIKALNAEHLQLIFQTVFSEAFVDHATQTSNGTKMPRANWDVLEKYPVPVPDKQTLETFNSTVSQWIDLANALMKQNHNLKTTRDLLLPKLISGEIDLSAAFTMEKAA